MFKRIVDFYPMKQAALGYLIFDSLMGVAGATSGNDIQKYSGLASTTAGIGL